MLFLDEPTSGLDSFAAQRVVATSQLCATRARRWYHALPICGVFAAFESDGLSEGECMYHGPICDLDARLRKEGSNTANARPYTSGGIAPACLDMSTASAIARPMPVAGGLGEALGHLPRTTEFGSCGGNDGEMARVGPRRRPPRNFGVVPTCETIIALKLSDRRWRAAVIAASIYGCHVTIIDDHDTIQDRFG